MSAIAGFVHKDGTVAELATLQAMQHRLAFWGSDRSSIWIDGSIGLAHVLMINTPQSRFERQPYADPAAPHIMIVADARLDNRDELLDSLSQANEDGSRIPDNVLTLRAHAHWGAACLDHMRGAFAFAIWNARSQELFCARDHLGCRPLYYHDDANRFAVATDPQALLAIDGISQELDPIAVVAPVLSAYRYLRDHSFHCAIAKLPPGHCLHLRRGVLTTVRYWQPERLPAAPRGDIALHAKTLRKLLRDAIASQTRSIYSVGSHLSGGIDSAAVSVLASRHLRENGGKLDAVYSWSPPPESAALAVDDERRRIAALCEHEGLSCRFTQVTPELVFEHSQRDSSSAPTEVLIHESVGCRAAAAEGVRVILTGWGGDEFASFSGRGAWAEHFWRGRWLALLQRLAGSGNRYSKLKAAVYEIVTTSLPDRIFSAWQLDLPQLFRKALARGMVQLSILTADELRLVKNQGLHLRLRASVRKNMLAQLEDGHLSRRMEDWAAEGARHGIEYRYPLLDRRIVEYCLSLPAGAFVHSGFPRFLMRAAICDLLPADWRWADAKSEPAKISTQDAAIAAVWAGSGSQVGQGISVTSSHAALRAHQLAALQHRVLTQDP
jgi:asparagine synthase (glutamine-hydrolysing)